MGKMWSSWVHVVITPHSNLPLGLLPGGAFILWHLMDDEIYTQNILERYRHPKNKRVMADFTLREAGVNPSCGDSLMLYLRLSEDAKEDGRVEDASWDGEGCAISQAAADMLAGKLHGMAKEDLKKISEQDIYDMLGIRIGPGREKCALLAYATLKRMLHAAK